MPPSMRQKLSPSPVLSLFPLTDVVEEVQAVYGEAARLPCNMTVNSGDTVYLVLWFKEELATPIYSYDVRELLRGQPKHWWDADLLGSRAFFNAGSSPHLLLQGLTSADAGLYKCRVDFQREPTRNTRINLTVVGKVFFRICSSIRKQNY